MSELIDPDVQRFREHARAWLDEFASPYRRGDGPPSKRRLSPSDGPGPAAEARAFQRELHAGGLAGITWPVAYGGRGLAPEFQAAFDREAAPYDLPTQRLSVTLDICLPTVLRHGSEAQRLRFIPAALRGEIVLVQLLSEPSAGSDLAAVRTSARRAGGGWVMHGSKLWSSGADQSDWGLCLARTDWDAPKHQGLTMFLVDMHSPEISVLPLRQITGEADFNEEFLDDVTVADDLMLGLVGGGWDVARTVLAYERGGGAGPTAGLPYGSNAASAMAADLIATAYRRGIAGSPVARQLIAEAIVGSVVCRHMTAEVSDQIRSGALPPDGASLVKLTQALFDERRAEIGMTLGGMDALAFPAGADDGLGSALAFSFLDARKLSIAGGTNEIQQNIIGERVLGLPREPDQSRTIPFRMVTGA